MLSKRVVLFAVAFSLLFFTIPSAIHAQQVSTGTVTGTVTDPSGAVVAGADVTLTDTSTHAARKLASNADGHYFFVNIPPGTYELTVSKSGFRTGKVANQEVSVGITLTLNVKLELGVATEVVEVQAGAGAELQTLNATVTTSFSGVSVDSLPAIGRDVATFVTLQPGVMPDGSVAGAVYDQNTFQLDGGQNTNDMDGGFNYYSLEQGNDTSGGMSLNCFTCEGGVPSGVMPTPMDSIEEFKISTTGQTADFNSSAGAQVALVTRRGHDAWHGTAYEYYLNNIWNADTFANDAAGEPEGIPHFHYSRFGGAVGGPIISKKILGGKTYFFGNYEGFRYPNATTIIHDVPGPGMIDGLLSFCTTTAASGACTNYTVYNLNSKMVPYSGPTIADAGGTIALKTGTTYLPGGSAVDGTGNAAACGAVVSCDPRGLGVSPTMDALWALLPKTNYFSGAGMPKACGGYCDGINIQGYISSVGLPTRTDFAVARIDHDFGDKEHFFSTYRYYRLARDTVNQTDLSASGALTSLSNRPQEPWFFATGLTSNLTSNFTNDLHYSYLRNWWLWGDFGAPPQLTGLSAALEPGGDGTSGSGVTNLIPYNVNNQDIRQRFWDGQDNMIRDDMTRLWGNHLLQWGGTFQRNYNEHSRNDNGTFTNEYPTYVMATGVTSLDSGINMTGFIPAAVDTASGCTTSYWCKDYAMTLGLLTIDQYVASRSGPQLTLNQPLTPVEDQSVIDYYNVYFTDSWHFKPTITFTYGLAWTVEMPPVERNGKQIVLVNDENQPIVAQQYLKTREQEALEGNVYNPTIGYTLVDNSAGGQNKYPFNPYYGEFAPRAALAWSPNYDSGILGSVFGRNKTVVRGGFAMIYGRINGVQLVLVPLLGYGLLQGVQCFGPTMAGTCAGEDMATPVNGFRIGPSLNGPAIAGTTCTVAPCWDGGKAPLAAATTPPCTATQLCTTLPQPAFPGINSLATTGVTTLDPNFRPNRSYEFDFTIQRQLGSKVTVEAGYIGRIIRNEWQGLDINAAPYMFTLTCPAGISTCTQGTKQQFQTAYAALVMQYCQATPANHFAGMAGGTCNAVNTLAGVDALTPQPFFEAALGGIGSAYCKGYTSCTAAVAANEGNSTLMSGLGIAGAGNLSSQNVWALWSDLDAGPFLAANGGALTGPTMLQNSGQLAAGVDGVGTTTSLGWGNYNSLFLSSRTADWRGLTVQSNFTYGKALGIGALSQPSSGVQVADPYDIGRSYGPQSYDRKFVFNTFLVYQPPYYKNQHGVIGHLLGGWTIAPIFVAGSGNPLGMYASSLSTEFGASDGISFGASDQAIPIAGCSGYQSTTSRHDNVPGTAAVGGNGPYAISIFKNPVAEFNCFRNPILGYDNGHNGDVGNVLRGLAYWNVDMQVRKTTHITERLSFEFQVVFANLFNHSQFYDPFNSLGDGPDFGALETPASSGTGNPRQFEFGGRIRF